VAVRLDIAPERFSAGPIRNDHPAQDQRRVVLFDDAESLRSSSQPVWLIRRADRDHCEGAVDLVEVFLELTHDSKDLFKRGISPKNIWRAPLVVIAPIFMAGDRLCERA